MTREEKCKLAIERGYTYNPETGFIYNPYGKIYKRNVNGYIQLLFSNNENKIKLYAHQFAWYCQHKQCVEQLDHINGIRNDNRIFNLRAVTQQQNQWNKINSKGYCWHRKNNKYQSQIKLNNKLIYLGSFNTEEEARNAYLKAKEIYHKF